MKKIKHDMRFDSLFEFNQWLDDTPKTEDSGSSSTRHSDDREWDFALGYEGAREYAKGTEFWQEGTDQITRGVAGVQGEMHQSARPVLSWDVAGFAPDVPAMLAGQPDHMFCMEYQNESVEIVTIGFCGFSARCTAKAMLNRGAALLTLVDALESSGKRCEIWYDDVLAPVRMRVCLKKSSEQWSAHTLAFSMAHPGFFRRLGFAWREKFTELDGHTNSGYGVCEEFDDYTFNLTYQAGDGPYRTFESALAHMEALAKEQGFTEINLGVNS